MLTVSALIFGSDDEHQYSSPLGKLVIDAHLAIMDSLEIYRVSIVFHGAPCSDFSEVSFNHDHLFPKSYRPICTVSNNSYPYTLSTIESHGTLNYDPKMIFSGSKIRLSGGVIEIISSSELELKKTSLIGHIQVPRKFLNNINFSLFVEGCELIFNYRIPILYLPFDLYSTNNTIILLIKNSKVNSYNSSIVSFLWKSMNINSVKISIVNSIINTNSNVVFMRITFYIFTSPLVTKSKLNFHITVEDSVIVVDSMLNHNLMNRVGFYISMEDSNSAEVDLSLTMHNCTVQGNAIQIVPGKASPLIQKKQLFKSLIRITLNNVLVEGSALSIRQVYDNMPVIKLVNVDEFVMTDSKIINCCGTAIEVYYSYIRLSGYNVFANNTGIKGGALALYQSHMILSGNSTTVFRHNHAMEEGGAIYVHMDTPSKGRDNINLCSYLIDANLRKGIAVAKTVNAWFYGNTALQGGDNMYGESLYRNCRAFTERHEVKRRISFIDGVFHYDNSSTSLSLTASDPTRVCLCDEYGQPQCTNIDYIYRQLPPRYPGEVFNVSVVIVGYDFGTVPGIVLSELAQNDGKVSLDKNQKARGIPNHQVCTNIDFYINSLQVNRNYTIYLRTQQTIYVKKHDNIYRFISGRTELDINRARANQDIYIYKHLKYLQAGLQYQQVSINIALKKCPAGFALTAHPPHMCICHPTLVHNGITVCNITNHTGWVYRSGSTWVSVTNDSLIVHRFCPHDYCKRDIIPVNLLFPDTQCAFKHSGILCGGCQGNLSLALGTSNCLACDNHFLSLLLLFLLVGPILVLFIKLLDLTVARGTMNGLILYANIVWASKSIFIPTTEVLNLLQQVLYTFIAWLNLDLGIETCFINGLTTYWKTWMQFLFPVYVWIITGLVIIISHYSTRASRIFGNDSVPVLATLVLLSYAKVLRTIIISLSFSLLEYNNETKVVWSFDGNIPYLGTAHAFLFLTALAALLVLWLPYTSILFKIQWLRRWSNFRLLRWINKLKPFFDAYLGDLKPKHHYWIGLLLFVRVLLLSLFSTTSTVLPNLSIVAIIVCCLTLLIVQVYTGPVYKHLLLSILENAQLVNLILLGVVSLFMDVSNKSNTAVVYTSIGFVFLMFLAIVTHHILLRRIKSVYQTYKCRKAGGENSHTPAERELIVVTPALHNNMQYREPLLESETN